MIFQLSGFAIDAEAKIQKRDPLTASSFAPVNRLVILIQGVIYLPDVVASSVRNMHRAVL